MRFGLTMALVMAMVAAFCSCATPPATQAQQNTDEQPAPSSNCPKAECNDETEAMNESPPPQPSPDPEPAAAPQPQPDPIFVGAGDIATCWSDSDEATAKLLDAQFADNALGNVFTLGDNAYDSGSAEEYANCYDPTWGRHKSRTMPTPGNHEYKSGNANGYFGYFGTVAGDPAKGYYSYDLGAWHIVVLNSNCSAVGGCSAGSPQVQWLKNDLAASSAKCTLAYFHRPRFSSGVEHGSSTTPLALWQALYDAGADVILSGHEHNYERFSPQDPNGVADPAKGIRQFVVGTGGADLYPFGASVANSEARNSETFGVLKLALHAESYDWEFIPIAGQTFTDKGSAKCHYPGSPAIVSGQIPGINGDSLFGVYYDDWDDGLINEVTGKTGKRRYDIVLLHPYTNVSASTVSQLRGTGVNVFCYISIGEDDAFHSAAYTGDNPGPGGSAQWYYDSNGDNLPDKNGEWDSYYVNPSNQYWRDALRTYRNENGEGWYGYDYLINDLGCDGLFLDTIETVGPAEWGSSYSAELDEMIDLVADIRSHIPNDRYLMINRGIFYFDPYDPATNPDGLKAITTNMRDRLRSLINGLQFEQFMTQSNRDEWAAKLAAEGAKPDGFTILTLDYSPVDVGEVCAAIKTKYGFVPHVSTYQLDTFVHLVRDGCYN